ncbi:hypothetical protein VTK26DRAFT_1118 [Humicola hyalothermophila]
MDNKTLSSRLRELVKFLSTVKGDLANVTGPPSLLAPSSVVEVGHCWAQHPAVFAAPALEPCPQKRTLLVLRWFLIALRSQLYTGVDFSSASITPTKPKASGSSSLPSIRKPLNAFLGELFFARWTDAERKCATSLVAEQVSHHPPITAMHVSDREHGVRADGYARVEMSFNGAVNVRQLGHAVYAIDRYREEYLVPLPDVRVRGFLSGCMYPEIVGTYHIVSSAGFVVEVRFSGEGMLMRGKRNWFEARVYSKEDRTKESLYEVSGCWSEGWTVREGRTGDVLEVYEVDAPENAPVPMEIEPVERQDPWESRRAWDGVLRGLKKGDMRMVVEEKTKIEQAQRQMRASEAARGVKWEPLLFRSGPGEEHHVFHRLSEDLGWPLHHEKTKGVWKVDDEGVRNLQRPFRAEVTPFGY